MKKFIVETYYTCTFKTVHTLDNLNDQELARIDSRNDGEVEVIDVKLNNRKTKNWLPRIRQNPIVNIIEVANGCLLYTSPSPRDS